MANLVTEISPETTNELLVRAVVMKNRTHERVLGLITDCQQVLSMNLPKRSTKRIVGLLIGYAAYESPTLPTQGVMPTGEELEDFIGKLKERGVMLDAQERMARRIKMRAQKAPVTTS